MNSTMGTVSLAVNGTEDGDTPPHVTSDNASWILANAFLILTMQTGFGMLEAGCVSAKNVANIMMKNVIDVSIGGITYWAVGYAFSFGPKGTSFFRYGNFFTSTEDEDLIGNLYTHYFFQFSFATAATTIVSGAVAERMKLEAYMVFSSMNIMVYSLPACWAWSTHGFLASIGFFDFAGACIVHMSGGASALVAAGMLGPRLGRFTDPDAFEMSSPVTALTGTFMLWWAWLAFNCGSTFGISDGLWRISSQEMDGLSMVAVTTINGSIGGALVGLVMSVVLTWGKSSVHKFHFDIGHSIQGVLGGLVGITASCAVITPRDALLIGAVGGFIAIVVEPLLHWMKVDDPVGAVAVHFGAAIWSTLSVGLFGKDFFGQLGGKRGLFYGGGAELLIAQAVGVASVALWAMGSTAVIFGVMKYTIGIRMDFRDEVIGADWTEHATSRAEGEKMVRVLEEIEAKGVTTEKEMIRAIQAQRAIAVERKNTLAGESGARVRNFAGSHSGGANNRSSVATGLAINLRKNLDAAVAPAYAVPADFDAASTEPMGSGKASVEDEVGESPHPHAPAEPPLGRPGAARPSRPVSQAATRPPTRSGNYTRMDEESTSS